MGAAGLTGLPNSSEMVSVTICRMTLRLSTVWSAPGMTA
jgi:hypothetical protein